MPLTGSNIFGITDTNRQISNFDYHHYAATTARHLSFHCVHKIIAGETDQSDSVFIKQVLEYFHLSNLSELIVLGSKGFADDPNEQKKLLGDMAPIVTNAALNGSCLAAWVCSQAASELSTGIRLIGSNFKAETVPVALIGSVINSAYIKNSICEKLSQKTSKVYRIAEPSLPSVLGAVLMAMRQNELELSEPVLNNLCISAMAISG